MTHFLRGVVLSLALTCAGMATTITFSGTGISGSGDFSGVNSGTTITGSVTVDSATNDLDGDEPNNNGQYFLLVGGIQLNISGFGTFQFFPSEMSDINLKTSNSVEGTDMVELTYFFQMSEQAKVTFFGDESGNFVTAPAGANGIDALNQINWAHFATGNVTISTFLPVIESSTVGAAEIVQGDAFFTIDNATNVPEPGTALVVLAGVAAIWMKRRSA
jgi:hypothetical protein